MNWLCYLPQMNMPIERVYTVRGSGVMLRVVWCMARFKSVHTTTKSLPKQLSESSHLLDTGCLSGLEGWEVWARQSELSNRMSGEAAQSSVWKHVWLNEHMLYDCWEGFWSAAHFSSAWFKSAWLINGLHELIYLGQRTCMGGYEVGCLYPSFLVAFT